jgi:hypothetical protein
MSGPPSRLTARMEIPLAKRYQRVRLGHCVSSSPKERRFITEELIRRRSRSFERRSMAAGANEVQLDPIDLIIG